MKSDLRLWIRTIVLSFGRVCLILLSALFQILGVLRCETLDLDFLLDNYSFFMDPNWIQWMDLNSWFRFALTMIMLLDILLIKNFYPFETRIKKWFQNPTNLFMKSLQEKGVEMSNQWGEISEERLCGESTILSLRVNSNLQTARKILLSALEYEFLSQFTIEVIRKWTLCFHLFFLQILVKLVNQGQFWNLHVMRILNHQYMFDLMKFWLRYSR